MNKTKIPALPKTIVQADMRKINRSAILEFLRLSGPVSRSEISDQLGLSRPSVKRIIDRLIDKGFVIPIGKTTAGKGRARELLSLNQTNNTVIGIDVGGSHISGALVTIGGEILIEDHQPEKWGDAEENFSHIQTFIENLIQKSHSIEHRLLGVGVGIPGIIEPSSGTVTIAPSLSWSNFPFLEKIQPDFNLPIYVENDVALATLGEHWFGSGIGKKNLVLIAIGTGIGAGIIIEGNLYRGHTNAAGEIGYFLPGREHLNNQYPGFGALEQLASGKGIADRAREIFSETNPPLAEIDDTAAIIKAARMKKPWAQKLIEENHRLLQSDGSQCQPML